MGMVIMKKEKIIETPELLVRGNIMKWKGTTIQLSNVSYVSTSHLDLIDFPIISIFIIIIGIFCIDLKYILN